MSEREFAAWAERAAPSELTGVLSESHPVYEGKGELAVARMRGFVLSRLAHLGGCDDSMLPLLREEIETGHAPYTVAAAARLLARRASLPSSWRPLVEQAIRRMRSSDRILTLDAYPLDRGGQETSAVTELEALLVKIEPGSELRTLQLSRPEAIPRPASVLDTLVEDHLGRTFHFRDFLIGKPTFVLFFYTRCNNPIKCSANVSRWGELIRSLTAAGLAGGVRTAAITYDPDFDDADRLRGYAEARSVPLGEDHRVLRVPERFLDFRRAFALRVGYSHATVNHHSSEAFLFDANGSAVASYLRTPWTIEAVGAAITELAPIGAPEQESATNGPLKS